MEKVIVGMSGGVDSSVCAYLLKEQGYEVIGVTYDFWHDDDLPEDIYRNLSDASEARAVCEVIGIPHLAVNYTKEFRERVEKRFTEEYLRGRTPNPCIICNREVKWAAMQATAMEHKAMYMSTGHYARLKKLENGRYAVRNSVTAAKDQTYVLYRLTQEQLRHTLFPIGSYDKSEIRAIAARIGIPVAGKKDSQDICYIDDRDYAGYIMKQTGSLGSKGNFVDVRGNVLGPHKGTACYTIGQRKGLGLSMGSPVYVCNIDTGTGDVCVGSDDDLYSDSLTAGDLAYMAQERFDENKTYTAKIRYSQNSVPCHVSYANQDTIRVQFEKKVRAATPGQSLVLYDDDWIAGGGTISFLS